MKKRTFILLTLVYFVCACMELSTTAYAYIDPATTTYVIQAVAGVVIACGATVLVFWRRIQFWFKKKKAERVKKQRAAQRKNESEK